VGGNLNLGRGTQSRLTFDNKTNAAPVWSPDGTHITFTSSRDGGWNVYQKSVNGIGGDEAIYEGSANFRVPSDWSRHGRYIVEAILLSATTKVGIWVLPVSPEQTSGGRKSFPYLNEQFNETQGKLSPSGQWLAYASDETGRYEIYVQTFPKLGGKWPVSINGGTHPVWSRDGKGLYFIGANGKLMAVDVKSGPDGSFDAGAPMVLFDSHIGGSATSGFDVTKDGRFLIPTQAALPSERITL
jgi:eukaryotic-like serine/threonine-protein kinase